MSGVFVDPAVVGLGAFLACEHDRGINYRAVMEATGPDAVAAVLAGAERKGMWCSFRDEDADEGENLHRHCYAVLDLLDADGDEIGDQCIPTVEAWAWWVRAVELRATSSDCRRCEPEAFAAVNRYRLGRSD